MPWDTAAHGDALAFAARIRAADAWRRSADSWRAAFDALQSSAPLCGYDADARAAFDAQQSTAPLFDYDSFHADAHAPRQWPAFLDLCAAAWRRAHPSADAGVFAFRCLSPAPPTAKHLTLLFLVDGERVLLGRKKRGFGQDKFNGFGGKVDPGETLLDAALREMHEESGVALAAAVTQQVGYLSFTFTSSPDERLEVHVFTARASSADLLSPVETEEMAPEWFPIASLPLNRMWADDAHWLPRVLRGERVRGDFVFSDHSTIAAFQLEEVELGQPISHATGSTVLIEAGSPRQGSILLQ
jgi:ADP-ribose pyrophosphatase YjhB (NUDIX family)